MGFCSKFRNVAATLVLFVALFVGVVKQLDEVSRFDVLSIVLFPLFRFGWSTELLQKRVIMKKIDDTSFRMLGQATPKELSDWQVDAGDVVVATFAKSGTHLSLQVALQVLSEASEGTGDQMESLHHFMSLPELLTETALTKCEDKKLLHIRNIKELAPLGNRSLYGTHLDFHHMPMHDDARYIVMARDPADILLSFHGMLSKMLGPLGPRKEEVMPFLTRSSGGWAEFNLEWWKRRHQDNVLFLFYEDAVRDPPAMVAAIAKFLGKPGHPALVAKILERSGVKYMKKKHLVFDPPRCAESPMPVKKPVVKGESIMVNVGAQSRGAKMLDENTQLQIREYCQRSFAGSDVPIEKWPSCH